VNYITVYQFSSKGIRPELYAIALVPLFACSLLLFLSRYSRKRKQVRIWAVLVLALMEILTIYSAWGELSVDSACNSAFKSGRYSVVEGAVENFRPMPYEGHANEEFQVGSVRFSYSDYEDRPGFNQSSSHGGPIREGLKVKISYSDDCGEWPNTILKLEVQSKTP
jgi:hypothetical protein